MCIEKCKHGSGRGLHKPTLEIGKGGAFLLYYIGNGQMIHAGDPVQYANINTSYWTEHFYAFGRISTN